MSFSFRWQHIYEKNRNFHYAHIMAKLFKKTAYFLVQIVQKFSPMHMLHADTLMLHAVSLTEIIGCFYILRIMLKLSVLRTDSNEPSCLS